MSLAFVAICGITLGPLPPVPPTLEILYQRSYGCVPQIVQNHMGRAVEKEDLGEYFPSISRWWPVFTQEQLGGKVYLETLRRGIKPGILLPNDQFEFLNLRTYHKYRSAMLDGGIPVLSFQNANPKAFAAKATYAAAIGMSPLAALVTDGWSENAPFLHSGTYFYEHGEASGYRDLPLPARENHIHDSYLYYAARTPARGGGFSIVINPSMPPSNNEIQYPKLGISWTLSDHRYVSTPMGLESGIKGYLLAAGLLFAVPVGLGMAQPMPDILSFIGSSLSWGSFWIGIGLFLILGASTLDRFRKK